MATELNLDTLLENMKVNEFVKAFKNKAQWKKAKYAIFLVDYKLDGKKQTVVLPYKKANEAKQAFKKIKQEKIHPLKKVGLTEFELAKDQEGPKAKVQLTEGSLNLDLLLQKGGKLFDKIKLPLQDALAQAANAAAETSAEAENTEENTTITEEEVKTNLEDVKSKLQNMAAELGIEINL